MTMTTRPYRHLLLAFLLVFSSHGQPLDPRYRPQQARSIEVVSHPKQGAFSGRLLQQNSNATSCSLCSGFPVLGEVVPLYHTLFELEENVTCGDIDAIASTFEASYDPDSACISYQLYFANSCCLLPENPYVCEQTVRTSLLESYDAAVMPLPPLGTLQLSLKLEFIHITSLSVKEGTVQIFVWLHMAWKDPRLAWEVNEENCTTSFTARASLDLEKTEIWVPDVDLLNQAIGVQEMPEAMANVFSDGTVHWSRNGGLKALCFFTGLLRFPFDTLGCSFLIGGWTRRDLITIFLFNGTGFEASESLDEVIYDEYSLVVDQTETGYAYPPLVSMVYYNFYFHRSSRYYVLKILVPTIVFTVLSFGVFFLDFRLGERLTYGLTVLLVIIAQGISTSELLPITDQRLWLNTFVNGSFYWVLICNLESVFVAWLYFVGDYHDDETSEKKREADSVTLRQRDEDQAARAFGESGQASSQDDAETENPKSVSFGGNVDENDNRGNDDDDPEDSDDADRPSRRALFVRHLSRRSSRRFLTLKQLLFTSTKRKRHETIRCIDRWCFYILSISYTLFVIIMLATNSLWHDKNDLPTEENPRQG